MRLLLDTNVLIALVDERLHALEAPMRDAVTDSEAVVHASVASLWEIAIKVRLGKLALAVSPRSSPSLCNVWGFNSSQSIIAMFWRLWNRSPRHAILSTGFFSLNA